MKSLGALIGPLCSAEVMGHREDAAHLLYYINDFSQRGLLVGEAGLFFVFLPFSFARAD